MESLPQELVHGLVPCLVCQPRGGAQWEGVEGFNRASPLIAALALWSVWHWGTVSQVNKNVWCSINANFW